MFRAVAAAVVTIACSFGANAITLEPLPGSTPQSTCVSCTYPQPIGVIVRDDAGNPLAGVDVEFDLSTAVWNPFVTLSPYVTVMTDAQGIARISALIGGTPGDVTVLASVLGGYVTAQFALHTTTQFASQVFFVTGDNQVVEAGAPFSHGWTARALDENMNPVPHTVLFFVGDFGSDMPNAIFPTSTPELPFVLVEADDQGFATSPVPVANEVVGWGQGKAYPYVNLQALNEVAFPFHIVNDSVRAASAQAVSGPAPSLMINTRATTPFILRAVDATGKGKRGVPVRFHTSQLCGSLGGELAFETTTDPHGFARSPLYGAEAPYLACPVYAHVAGEVQAIQWDIHNFNPDVTVMTPSPAWVTTTTGSTYRVTIDFTESGLPVQPLSLEAVKVPRGGPTAGIEGVPAIALQNNRATIDLRANHFAGSYDVEVVLEGPTRVKIPVVQVAR